MAVAFPENTIFAFIAVECSRRSFGAFWKQGTLDKQLAAQATPSLGSELPPHATDIDFSGIVKGELERRRGQLPEACEYGLACGV